MDSDSKKDYFNTFKVGTFTQDPQTGNLQEYSKEEMKTRIQANGDRVDALQVFYADGSDAYANRGFVVSFMHVASQSYVHFKAFINALNETYNSDWSSEPVYGRTDPIKMFKQTTRSITLSLIVPASSESEGFENLAKVSELLSYLYPTYTDADNALTISQSPLVRMRVMNLIKKTNYRGPEFTENHNTIADHDMDDTGAYIGGSYLHHRSAVNTLSREAVGDGLLGTIRNVSVNHNIDNVEMGSFVLADGVIIPRAIEVTLDFDVLHERTVGWRENGETQSRIDKMFPYGIDLDGSEVNSEADLFQSMRMAADAAVVEYNIEESTEQQRQNAIAAGYLIAAGVTEDGKIRYEMTNKGERALDKINNRLKAKKDKNIFNARPFPEDQIEEAEDMKSFLSNPEQWVS